MEIKESDIIAKTHYGLNIYSLVLRQFYPNEVVISLSGRQCKPARNPFLGNSETLIITNIDNVFLYTDSSDANFKGNPFDFASLYYKITGLELLNKLNDELGLKIGQGNCFYQKIASETSVIPDIHKPKIHIPKFSFFKRPITNTKPDKELNVFEVYKLINSDLYKLNTLNIRQLQDKAKSRVFKAQNFDYVTFSGTFSKRTDNDLIKHSGLITIDFDHVHDLEQLRQALLKDEYFDTELLFVSPSGDGLKWIIQIDLSQGSHQLLFSAIAAYIKKTYNLEVDKSGKDISRACFLPYDNNIFINPKYLIQ
jgi:VirE N-terminal domain.